MARIAIVGGHGKIARQLIGQLVNRGHAAIALVRSSEQEKAVAELGAEPGRLDIEREDVSGFERAFEGCQAVVFSAGAGNDGSVERKRTDRKSTRLNSSHVASSYAVFCLKKKILSYPLVF